MTLGDLVNMRPKSMVCNNLMMNFQAIYANFDFGRSVSDGSNTEEEVGYASPPSPVSSSYSELRVATRVPLGHGFHHQMNPQAMIYDPLYEPISGQNAVANQHKPNFGLGGSSSHYDDSFGPCSKCLDLIVGTSTGCSAMGRLYHIKCFTCHHCGCQLQGKPYYALDGKVCLMYALEIKTFGLGSRIRDICSYNYKIQLSL